MTPKYVEFQMASDAVGILARLPFEVQEIMLRWREQVTVESLHELHSELIDPKNTKSLIELAEAKFSR
jgi:hypothetical protein